MLSKADRDFANSLRVCRFSSIDEEGFPHVVPLSVSADSDYLYVSGLGRRLDRVRSNPRVCLVIDDWPRKRGVMIRGLGDVVEGGDYPRIRIRPIRRASWDYSSSGGKASGPEPASHLPFVLYVAGVVTREDELLATRRIIGASTRRWTIPGGFPMPEERFSVALTRIVEGMTGVKISTEGLLGVRHLVYGSAAARHNEVHLLFRAKWVAGETTANGVQADMVQFMSLNEFREKAAQFSPLSTSYLVLLEKAFQAHECLQEVVSSEQPEATLSVAYL